ncbi:hypothetical protein SESBI_23060 [Sesbania bispinosa]|nr:hypothetical protein SESBI_23060 [Sesbania bispinosa]
MAGNNILELAEKRACREAQKVTAAAAAASASHNVSKSEGEEASNSHVEKRPRLRNEQLRRPW